MYDWTWDNLKMLIAAADRTEASGHGIASQDARVFVSYDYDHDSALKKFLVGQARHNDTPFFVEDWSIKKATQVAGRLTLASASTSRSQVIVICGHHTNEAVGVAAEIADSPRSRGTGSPTAGCKDGKLDRPRGTVVVLRQDVRLDLGQLGN